MKTSRLKGTVNTPLLAAGCFIEFGFSSQAWEDDLYWQKTDKSTVKRIHSLIKAIQQTPFEGIGKPEPLKHGLSGYWSRRINDEHRIVYKVNGDELFIAQLRYHY